MTDTTNVDMEVQSVSCDEDIHTLGGQLGNVCVRSDIPEFAMQVCKISSGMLSLIHI